MTSLIRLIFPNFDPAPTVENFGVRTSKDVIPRAVDDRELEKRLDELFARPRAAASYTTRRSNVRQPTRRPR